ncbi:MAG TPA: hypothetical protein VL334_11400 [Anaerolineae bacterium]|nr:hypothetical protein [Anaerolineae bacterium]
MQDPHRSATALLTLLLSITAVIGALYGVVTLLTPAAYLQMLGLDANPSAILQARYFGAAVLGAGLMLGMARKAQELTVQRALSLGNFAVVTGSAVVTVIGLSSGLLNAVGWGFLASEVVLAIGYGYVLVRLLFSRRVRAD